MEFVGKVEMNALRPAFEQLDKWLARDNDPISTLVQPNSRTALDDAATDPHHLSHAVLSALSHGLDHLHCFRSLVIGAEALHIYAPFSLFRSAIENFSTALWLLEPDDRETRVRRRLQLAAANIKRGEEVRKLAQDDGEDESDRRLKVVSSLADAAGIRPDAVLGATPGFERIVRESGEGTQLGGDLLVLLWKVCSGITHGQQWASLGLLERGLVHDPDAAGVVRLQLSAPHQTVILMAQTVTVACRDAWRLYDRHRLEWKDHTGHSHAPPQPWNHQGRGEGSSASPRLSG